MSGRNLCTVVQKRVYIEGAYLLLHIISVYADLVGVSDKIVFIFSVIVCESCQLFCKREVVVLVRTGV